MGKQWKQCQTLFFCPVFLPGEFHGQRSLIGYSPWGCKDSDRTKQLHTQAHDLITSQSLYLQTPSHWGLQCFSLKTRHQTVSSNRVIQAEGRSDELSGGCSRGDGVRAIHHRGEDAGQPTSYVPFQRHFTETGRGSPWGQLLRRRRWRSQRECTATHNRLTPFVPMPSSSRNLPGIDHLRKACTKSPPKAH